MSFAVLVVVGAVFNYSEFSLVCAGTAVVLYAASMSRHIASGMNWRWVQFLGLVSYSLYLIHNPVTGATFRVG
jgi:peptidoglycan/LPS O-acetylase OafA/YrhL